MDSTKNQRPGGDSEALMAVALNHDNVTLSERTDENPDADVVVRCRCCGRVLTAEKSRAVELGPVCRTTPAEVVA